MRPDINLIDVWGIEMIGNKVKNNSVEDKDNSDEYELDSIACFNVQKNNYTEHTICQMLIDCLDTLKENLDRDVTVDVKAFDGMCYPVNVTKFIKFFKSRYIMYLEKYEQDETKRAPHLKSLQNELDSILSKLSSFAE